jgi:hypothetical protein
MVQEGKRPVHEISNRDFFDPDFYKTMLNDFEDIRRRRKLLKGRPDAETVCVINCEKDFESFYKRFLDL